MRAVPRFSGTSIRDQRSASEKAAAASHLQWRTSPEVAPPKPMPVAVVQAQALVVSDTKPPTGAAANIATPVMQVRYQNTPPTPGDTGGLTLPPGLQSAPTPPAAAPKPLPDFFADPFGEADSSASGAPSLQIPKPAEPQNNELRSAAPLDAPRAPQATAAEDLPAPPTTPKAVTPPNPFDRTRTDEERAADEQDKRKLEDIDLPLRPRDKTPDPAQKKDEKDEDLKKPTEFSCDEFRESIAAAKIQGVSLDISPPFRPDVIELAEYRKLKAKFDAAQEVRDWQSIDGRKLGRGRLRDLAYEKVVIETEFGTQEELQINRISEADIAYISKNWGLPQQCLIEQVAYQPRSWQPSKVTWKASNLCHKPLYFEEVNLERYGHTAGPFLQPVISSAHFFVNIAVLPYKMGVHSPSECQYALGYYRPGDCAPWIVPPVPISLRGGLYEAAFLTGGILLIP